MSVSPGLRHILARYLPSWLADNYPASPSYGYRILWSIAALVDAAIETSLQGSLAAVGRGHPDALKYIGEARGVIRGQGETDEEYFERLRGWIERAKESGSMRGLARALHEYLGNSPRVRIVSRSGTWVTCETDGTITTTSAPWDWDSVSHPERAGWWAEQWVIIYPTQWALNDNLGDPGHVIGAEDRGVGHDVTRIEVDEVKRIIRTKKSAHTKVRAVIWTSDGTLFNPANPATCPDGTWGAWGTTGPGSRVASGRNTTTCRYWELEN